ncbi:MAG: hypothetical protein ABGW69_00185 [Nanoarchaeota archaeon]
MQNFIVDFFKSVKNQKINKKITKENKDTDKNRDNKNNERDKEKIDYSYYFSLLKIFFIAVSFVIFYTYIMSMIKYFNIVKKLSPYLVSFFSKLLIISFISTLLVISLINFNFFNFLALFISLLLEYLVNKTFLFYFYPVNYFFTLNIELKDYLPIGFFLYLAYFLAFYFSKNNLRLFIIYFIINFFVFLLYELLFLKTHSLTVRLLLNIVLLAYFLLLPWLFKRIKFFLKI